MREPLFSIIIYCKNEGEHIRHTLNSIKENSGNVSYELIVVDDASDDGCCDFLRNGEDEEVLLVTLQGDHAGRARNTGAEHAGGDIFVFCDAHIFAAKDWLEKLAGTLEVPGIDAVSPCLMPHDDRGPAWGGFSWEANMTLRWLSVPEGLTPVPVLPRGCLAVTGEAFNAVGGFEEGLRKSAYENVEFTMKLWLLGFGAYINPDVTVRHIFRSAGPLPDRPADIHYNLLRMALLHFNQNRLGKIIGLIKNNSYFPEIFTDVILSDALGQRKAYFGRRVYDDDWFVQKFNISL
ncbi:MAG: glycosyltransferase family 2 protein [Bacillota bacterium]